MPTSEEEAARAVLREIEGLGPFPGDYIGAERFDAEVAALVAFARRAKAEALREAAGKFRAFEVERQRHADTFTALEWQRDILFAKGSEAMRCADWCEREAAKLTETP
jgi:hypothetical protein